MLVTQLKNSNRPINYGEFTPRHLSRKGRGVSLDAHSPSQDTRPSTGGTPQGSLRVQSSCSPRSPAVGSLSLGSPVLPPPSSASRSFSRAVASKLVQEYKVFSNRNSYRGTWLDGRMHGDGLYTWSDGSEYAGEFREGYVWGEGEKRWPNGRKYRGEWVRDMMWGDGQMSWPTGESFTGQFRKGIFHGKGTRVWPNGDWYAGEFKNGEQEGEGTYESAQEGWVYRGRWLHCRMFGEGRVDWPNGIVYVGEWKDGVREGHGRLSWPDGSCYEGQFSGNCIEGRGRKVLPDGSWFEGHLRDGELEGHGTYRWADGTEFEGLWQNSEVVGPGRHRFPDGTTITGVFEDRGASGEGTKKWASGCSYTGCLHQNQIHHYGVLKWPDGRCYIGHFRDETMHGDGMLTWSDREGLCRYRGCFEGNLFHGEGVLEWSNKARYTGEFRAGHYHGEGTFEWPDRIVVYHGQWAEGEMWGRGVLAASGDMATVAGAPAAPGPSPNKGDPFVYMGEFREGHIEGRGHVTFLQPGGLQDEYKGDFEKSMFHGLGSFTWASGHSLTGLFERNHCNTVGHKVYPGGQVYYGALKMDLEHGRGVLTEGDQRLMGIWNEGICVQELFETFVPALELDAIEGEEWQKVFGGFREAEEPKEGRPGLPEHDADGEEVEGEAVVLYASGDKYVGHVKAGKKHGLGMYVYADLTAYKGQWTENVLGGVAHPAPEAECSHQALKLHKLNEENQRHVEALKLFAADGKTSLPEGVGAAVATGTASPKA
mmetsp:Transcript_67798/g.145121  ORF Transcript_67798/g.145121 Transcript_67798/m.145121 type:complete len:764 (+) Transcript_67798:49-2340(+)